MRWLWLLPLRFVAGLTGRLIRYAVMMLVVAAISLSFSIASFIIPGLAAVMVRAASAIANTAVVSVQQAQQLRQRNAELRRVNRSLGEANVERNSANRQLAGQNTRLATSNADLEARNASLATAKVDLEARNARNRAAVQRSSQRISSRSARATGRSVAMIPLESIPFLGAATIIATTSLDIHDTCATLEDMASLQRELGIDPPDEGIAAHICGALPVAGRRVDRYGDMTISECRTAAEEAQAEVLELKEREIDLPPDERDAFEADIREMADEEFAAINKICDCIADLACDPAEDIAR